MKIAVWIVSALLAVAFVMIGGMKVLTPADQLATMSMGVPVALLKIAGTAEILGALGLVVPAATRIMPILTPIAASGLVVTMIGATVTNIIINLPSSHPMTVGLGVLAAFVAWARFGPAKVEPRAAGATT